MDTSAPSFRSLTAKLTRLQYTAIIKDESEDGGTISLLKMKGKDIRVLVEIAHPAERYLAFGERKLEVYNPKAATVQEVDLGKERGLVDQFLLLGFGIPGRELSKNYAVRYGGEEKIGDQKASRLDLTPKSSKVLEHYNKVQLWIADPGGYPVRQKLVEPSGNYWQFTYSSVKLNAPLSAAQLQLKLPPNVKREYPQR